MPAGIMTAYDLTNGVIINMDTSIYLVSPLDSPMITGMGADGLSLIGSNGVDQIEFSWQDEEILTPRSQLGANATTGDAFIVVATGDRLKFSTGDLLRIVKAAGASEIVRVTGYSQTTDDALLVTRGWDTTSPTNHTSGAAIRSLGILLPEGSAPEAGRSKDRDIRSNYTQIHGPEKVSASRTQQKIRRYGVANDFSHQAMRRVQELTIRREYAALYGLKFNSSDAKLRTSGGAFYFVGSANENSTDTQLTVLTIAAAQQVAYNKGKPFDRLMCNPVALTDLNDINNTNIVRVTNVDSKRGRTPVTVVTTEHGDTTIARNRWIEPMDALGFNRENIVRRVFDLLQMEALAKVGDSREVMFVLEEGYQVKGPQHMFKFTNLGYTNTGNP
jgi:hypothetical protein